MHQLRKLIARQGLADYGAKLQDPRWEKRAKQTVRDHPYCKSCRRQDARLHCHHAYYSTPDPWDEPAENLVVLCEKCHENIHESFREVKRVMSFCSANHAFSIALALGRLLKRDGDAKLLERLTRL